ncbi:uncharacterized protein GGS22DRAFT_151934 [Annulohypoxylon maeteangense]|uniref:uncharacterized protein n=1 Tax=Annulohypoxylon maeteangense TaxID=1927788 RepID=UPI002008DC7F|nr:uncharacterized protein GGS22DRAFT_151934 [Annulohypoxylon maeteangense]KAI0888605.1 hypothetical protein GGS22DRAFT_151934 [Annulohypoxylon maeteangense]
MSDSWHDNDLPGWSLVLTDETNVGANFRFENDPQNPWQRDRVLEQRDLVHIRCDIRDIVHGHLTGADSDEGSLIIFRFRFEEDDLSRRIKLARIKVKFSALDEADPDPCVLKIHPEGRYSIQPTTRKERTTTSFSGIVDANIPVPTISAELRRDKTVEADVTSTTAVRGSIDSEGDNYGIANSASWTLMENTTDKTGVPTCMQCAVLIKRDGLSKFAVSVNISVQADRMTAFRQWASALFKQPRRVDPVWFDPAKKPTNRLREYDESIVSNLDAVPLDDPVLTEVTLWKSL